MNSMRAAVTCAAAVLVLGCTGAGSQPSGQPEPASPQPAASDGAGAPPTMSPAPAPADAATQPPATASAGLCDAAHEFFIANAALEEAPADASGDPELQARWDRQTAALDELLQWAPGALESGLVRLRDASAARDLEAFDTAVMEEAGVLQELDVLCPALSR